MKIGFFNPYLDGLGGGERYTLTLAAHWSKFHDVDVFWDDSTILGSAEKRFGLDLSSVRTVSNVFVRGNIFRKVLTTRLYDCIFYLTDGSVPTSFSKSTILHFQVPFAHVHANPIALQRLSRVVCNSVFTKNHLDSSMGTIAEVIYPPVRAVVGGKEKKEHMILSVGRFTSMHNAKKQDVLIDAFINLEKMLPDWVLVLAGGLLPSDSEYFQMLKKKAHGHNIRFEENISYDQLQNLYRSAAMYWHAAGFGETDPMYSEHFGITTVEASSAGAVPLVYKGGGQEEIIRDLQNGMTWSTLDELIEKTNKLVKQPSLYAGLQKNAKLIWKNYSEAVFIQKYDALLASIAG